MQYHSLDGDTLVRTLAHALRHHPEQYGLNLDDEGWVEWPALVAGLRHHRRDWRKLRRKDIEAMLARTESTRFETKGERIRAAYGHSIALTTPGTLREPPAILWHGTSIDNARRIQSEGLLPMERRFVHLTSDRAYAEAVAWESGQGVVVPVKALTAYREGVRFFQANQHVWLATPLPAAYVGDDHRMMTERKPTNLEIREATSADVATIVTFLCTLRYLDAGEELDETIVASGVAAVLADPRRGRYFMACLGELVVGQILVTPEWDDTKNCEAWWLRRGYVHPLHRQRGVLRALVEHVHAQASAGNSAAILFANTVLANEAGKRALRQFGYWPVCVTHRFEIGKHS